MKRAYLFYYQGKVESGATGHLEPKHVVTCVDSLRQILDYIVVRDDGSKAPLANVWEGIHKVKFIRVDPRGGINKGYAYAADDCEDDDLVMLVDPHNIYSQELLQQQFNRFDNPKLQLLFQDVTAFRVRQGDWATWRSEMNGPIGAEDGKWSVIFRGSALKRYKMEHLDKLPPEDQSYPIPHIQLWAEKFLQPGEYETAPGPVIGEPRRHVHDDSLDFWGQLRSCYSNGYKVAQINPEVSPGRTQIFNLLRAPLLAEKWEGLESLLNDLGMAAAKFHIGENASYWDVYWASEDVDYRFAFERPYMFTAANYVVGDVLDVGCGNGLFLNLLWNQRPHYHPGKVMQDVVDNYDHPGQPIFPKDQCWFPSGTGIDTSKVAVEKAKAYRKFNVNRVLEFKQVDFYEFARDTVNTIQGDLFDTVLMLEFLGYQPWQRRQEAIDLAFQLARHRVIMTVPAQPLGVPNVLKREDGRMFYTMDEAITLAKGFPEPPFVDTADIDPNNKLTRHWVIVADKRPLPGDWEPKIGKLREVAETGAKGDASR